MAETTSRTLGVRFYAAGLGKARTTGDEFVTVKNTGKAPFNLKGWTLRTRAGKVLLLRSRSLGVGDRVRVHPGRGRATATDMYLGRGASFGDRHDTLTLSDPAEVVIALKRY